MNIIVISYISFITIFIASALGASMVFFLNKNLNSKYLELINGFTSGVMISASIFGLIIPSLENYNHTLRCLPVFVGIILGTVFLIILDILLYENKNKKAYKLFASMTLHNIFEGLSIGLVFSLAYKNSASSYLISAISLTIGISLQNLPETFALSSILYKENKSKLKSFIHSLISGFVEPIFAVVGFILTININHLMPYFLSFSGGSMIYLTLEELLPVCLKEDEKYKFGLFAFIIGFCLMLVLENI